MAHVLTPARSINNVSHVGHAHSGVAAAVSTQLFTLNTNSRYLHEAYVEYAEAMAALCPAPLQARLFAGLALLRYGAAAPSACMSPSTAARSDCMQLACLPCIVLDTPV